MSYRDSHKRKTDYDGDLSAEPFSAYLNHWHRWHMLALLERRPYARALDFACGTGRITQLLTLRCPNVVGVDIAEAMVEKARAKTSFAEFVVGDITTDPDLGDSLGMFDLVTAFRFFGNADHELRHAAMRAIWRRQSRGGWLVLNHHRNPRAFANLRNVDSSNRMDLTHRELRRLLETYDYEIVSRRPIGAWKVVARLTNRTGTAPVLERLSSLVMPADRSPDCLVVARRVR